MWEPSADLKNTSSKRFVATEWEHRKCQVTECIMENEKATNNRAVSCQQVVSFFFHRESTIYDFPLLFEYQCVSFHFFGSPPFFSFWRGYFTSETCQQRWSEHMERADWHWNIYGPFVLWLNEFWQGWHITVTLPQTNGWCVAVCCVLGRWERVHAFSLHIIRFQTLNALCVKKIPLQILLIHHLFQYVVFIFALPLLSPILFSAHHDKECLPSLLSLPPLPPQYQISFPLPCHLCTAFVMRDWWLPLQYLVVIIKSLAMVSTNLQQVYLHTDCRWSK